MISGSASSLHSGALAGLWALRRQLIRLLDQRGNHLLNLNVRGPEAAVAVEEDEDAAGGREPTGQRGGLGAQRGVGEQGEGQPSARASRS